MNALFVFLWKTIGNNRKELCPRISNNCWILFLLIVAECFNMAQAQTFGLDVKSDSLALLTLTDGASTDTWRLPYPTYAFATADVDGDGLVDALVGVIKPTRFDPRNAPRLFVFRNVHGRIRPLWLGSRLCGELHNFRTAPPPASPPSTSSPAEVRTRSSRRFSAFSRRNQSMTPSTSGWVKGLVR